MSTHYTPAYSLPMRVPTKGGQYSSGYSSAYSVSPPEIDDDLSSTSGVASYSNSGYDSSSYAGSGDYDSAHSANGVDFNEYMQDRFSSSFNPIPLDKSMATQAQTSGMLNAKHRELLELQRRRRLASRRRESDSKTKMKSLKSKASRKHPKEYTKARTRYPSPE
ncbi:unnamed protein product [Parascedosporium putredinis]|uniref:Biogenesis of lysosome-related organelles complex 1 subunit KXD1 n=1 Tax=Parascedosporium putredinis TaxID=1442378 RepID=A0A9P1H879_9PEZI|nr:unnamed protein product [Parascedosporium putredinis]CAI7999499.1 unnamed protein product [Parascedosporium putredinis]